MVQKEYSLFILKIYFHFFKQNSISNSSLPTLKPDNKSLMLSIGTPLYTRFPFKTRGGFGFLYETSNALVFATAQSKGQLISECLFDNFKFSKEPMKNLTNFCPRI